MIPTPSSLIAALLGAVVLLGVPPVLAQGTPATPASAASDAASNAASDPDGGATVLPPVQSAMRRGVSIPYKQLNQILTTLRTEGEGLFVSRFTLTPAKQGQDLPPNLRMALMDDERTIAIPVDAKGRFELPTFPADEAKSMELASNVPKGSTGIRMRVDLTTPPERLDMAVVRRVVKVGQRLREELLPWYLRWLFPQIDGVTICSDRPDWSLEWREGGQLLSLPLSVEAGLREPDGSQKPSTSNAPAATAASSAEASSTPRSCTVLTGQEPWPDAARLQPPDGGHTKLYVKLRSTRPS
ncbi:hypothetical protein [Roseateles amylovorans]|uniref:DUF2987 domain-containing protein n=1 Tax=Roseateles amylovorans TaxID=2978473 RepID=A0ABY6B2L6_9BURK|nr:hypothetical protein [Roseateles amylovorans]UXH79636.1 hypothetical protein N4261_06900 [Roseateles amylovorans]